MKSKFFLKLTLSLGLFAPLFANAQDNDWHHKDLEKDKIPGVSSERAYSELLKGKTSKTIIVAIIDSGTDTAHEDLKKILWVNEKEIPGNGIDDDKNGYIDDIHGWNFIGGKGGNVAADNLELTRLYRELSAKYSGKNAGDIAGSDKKEYKYYLKIKEDFEKEYNENKVTLDFYNALLASVDKIKNFIGDNETMSKLSKFSPQDRFDSIALRNVEARLKSGATIQSLKDDISNSGITHLKGMVDEKLNVNFDPRSIVGDNYKDATERYYGNTDVMGPESSHGTHVAGIVAAIRNNGVGMDGIADNVRIMIIRCVPDGDERDKDVANAIRYAAENGASIINMSFGKAYSYNKKVVDDAVAFAASKDVLLIHAAGNDAKNTDKEGNFPNAEFEAGGNATNWIEVGASSWTYDKNIVADFSNYGKRIDLFAPGAQIYSTTPDSKYAKFNGTSMASPVVAGVAALVRSYYPNLTAAQVKEILLKSASPVKMKIVRPGPDVKVNKNGDVEQKDVMLKLKKISKTGGVVNVYNALKLAEQKSK